MGLNEERSRFLRDLCGAISSVGDDFDNRGHCGADMKPCGDGFLATIPKKSGGNVVVGWYGLGVLEGSAMVRTPRFTPEEASSLKSAAQVLTYVGGSTNCETAEKLRAMLGTESAMEFTKINDNVWVHDGPLNWGKRAEVPAKEEGGKEAEMERGAENTESIRVAGPDPRVDIPVPDHGPGLPGGPERQGLEGEAREAEGPTQSSVAREKYAAEGAYKDYERWCYEDSRRGWPYDMGAMILMAEKLGVFEHDCDWLHGWKIVHRAFRAGAR